MRELLQCHQVVFINRPTAAARGGGKAEIKIMKVDGCCQSTVIKPNHEGGFPDSSANVSMTSLWSRMRERDFKTRSFHSARAANELSPTFMSKPADESFRLWKPRQSNYLKWRAIIQFLANDSSDRWAGIDWLNTALITILIIQRRMFRIYFSEM